MKKKLVAFTCAACLCVGLSLPAAAVSFDDVGVDTWYTEAVGYVSDKGYMTGIEEGRFSPDTAVTRATVITTLWRLEGSPAAAVETGFPDVAAGAWYETAAAWAKGKGIATGSDKGLFNPSALVTRQELAVFLYRYAQLKGTDIGEGALNLFSDAKMTSLWAVDGMKHAIGLGLLQGSDEKIAPGGVASRGQLAVILQRLTTPVMG